MKKVILLGLILIITTGLSAQQRKLRTIENNAFQRGEYLKYRIFYDSWLLDVSAGEAVLQITNKNKPFLKRNTYHIIMSGQTTGLFDRIMKVDDKYESYMDEKTLAPWVFIRKVQEGKYWADQHATFNQYKDQCHYKDNKNKTNKIIKTSPYAQDIISAFYYARTFDASSFRDGDVIDLDFVIDDSCYTTKIYYEGRDTINTYLGKMAILKFKPMVLEGEVFTEPYPMELYVSDDENKIPVMIKSGVYVGSVKVELIYYEGLRNPFNALLEKSRKHRKMSK